MLPTQEGALHKPHPALASTYVNLRNNVYAVRMTLNIGFTRYFLSSGKVLRANAETYIQGRPEFQAPTVVPRPHTQFKYYSPESIGPSGGE